MSRMFVLYLGSVMLRSMGVAVVAGLCSWRMQNVARRHAVWLAVLGIMLLMPAVDATLPLVRFPAPLIITAESMPPLPVDEKPSALLTVAPVTVDAAIPARLAHWNLWQVAATLYGIVVLLLAFQMALANRRLQKIKRASRPVSTGIFNDAAPKLRESGSVRIPVTIGFLKPVVILPADWRTWDEWKLRAVLTHELTHVRRADWAVAMLAAFNTVVFWYNPLSWWLERRLASLCEEACDEASISTLGNPARYSEVLLEFATAHVGSRLRVGGVAMARQNIASRIERILSIEGPGSGLLTKACVAILAVITVPVLYAAAVIHAPKAEATTITVRGPGLPIVMPSPIVGPPPGPVARFAAPPRSEQVQQTTGILSGTIWAPGGTIAEGATIILSNLEVNSEGKEFEGKEVAKTSTDRFGEFILPAVPVGIYSLRARSAPNAVGMPFGLAAKVDLTESGKKKLMGQDGPLAELDFEKTGQAGNTESSAVLSLTGARSTQVQPAPALPKFEVVSIKPNRSGVSPSAMGSRPDGEPMGCHGVDRGPQTIPLGRCVFRNVTAGFLTSVVMILDGKEYELGEMPNWVTTEGFDIEVKAETPVTSKELGAMLVSVLVDRFKCAFHRETREVSGFALVVAKGGPKLDKAANQEPETQLKAMNVMDELTKKSVSLSRLPPDRTVLLVTPKETMATFASFISGFATRPVEDRTALAGFYAFQLRWQPERDLGTETIDRVGPSFTTALEEQLGLKLEAQKVSTEYLVIDHIERPTAN